MGIWSKMHFITMIPSFAVFILISIALAKLMKNENEYLKILPVQIIAIIIIFIEVVKQVYSIKRGYTLSHLPFHFCSLFVYLFPAFAFYKGKYKMEVRMITVVSCSMLLGVMLVTPNLIYNSSDITSFFFDFFSFHTVFFHNLVMLGYFYILSANLYEFKKLRDIKVMTCFYLAYCSIGIIMSQVLKTNFNAFLENPVTFVDNIRIWAIDRIDWVGHMLYVLILSLMIVCYAILCRWGIIKIKELVSKCKNKKIQKN